MHHFLAEALGNVVSAGFRYLCRTELEENEAKDMASKNVMINIYSIHRHVIQAILDSEFLKKGGNISNVDKLKRLDHRGRQHG